MVAPRSQNLWADRVAGKKEMDISKTITFSNSDPEDQSARLVEVSDITRQLWEQKCTGSMPDKEWLAKWNHYPVLKVAATRTPQLDEFIKLEVSLAVKSADREMAKIQPLLLDALKCIHVKKTVH